MRYASAAPRFVELVNSGVHLGGAVTDGLAAGLISAQGESQCPDRLDDALWR
jgi:hypothetical protein